MSHAHSSAIHPTAPPPLDASRFNATNRRRLSGPAMRTFIAIAYLLTLSQSRRGQTADRDGSADGNLSYFHGGFPWVFVAR